MPAFNPFALTSKILTKTIGDELVRLMTSTAPPGTFTICQYGGVERVAEIPKLGELLPAIFVVPSGSTEYSPEGILDLNGTHAEVIENYRISIWQSYITTDDPLALITDFANNALTALIQDPKLSNIAATIRPNQISSSRLVGVDWEPEEQLLLIETAASVKVAVLLWQVRWYSRG